MKNLIVKFSLVMLIVFGIAACTSTKKLLGFDTDLDLQFKVDSNSNPDEGNRPSPLFVRMYELKSPKLFEQADFITLFEKDQKVLGGDLVKKHRLKRLTPGEDRLEEFRKLEDATRYIGIFAEFLQYKNSRYKVIFEVTEANVIDTSKVVLISGNTMRLQKQ